MLATTDYQYLNAVLRPAKVKIESLILTAADSKFFVPLQALVASIKLSHDARLVVQDLGLTKTQRDWLERQGVYSIFSQRKQVVPKNVFFWQTWNKPFYLEQLHSVAVNYMFTPIIWIDADCIVTGSLETLDKLAQERFTIFADTASIVHNGFDRGVENATNKDYVYEKYPVNKRLLKGEQPNAGVIGINLNRTEDWLLLRQWQFMVRQSMIDKKLFDKKTAKHVGDQKAISWHDQGCLQWAIEKLGMHHCVLGDVRFNDPVALSNAQSYKEFIGKTERITTTRIAHFPSGNKPYDKFPKKFNPDTSEFPAQRKDLTILVLGHTDNRPLKKHFLKYVHLPDIDDDNDLAETRVFRSNILGKIKTDYIGLATAQWNAKYVEKCLPLEQLHTLPMQISRVWAAAKSDSYWFEYSEGIHKGISKYIYYLATKHDIENKLDRCVPWSNNFITHRSVVRDLQQWIWHCYGLLYAQFGCKLNYGMDGFDRTRTGSYLAERISMLFFCMRDDLQIEQIPCLSCPEKI